MNPILLKNCNIMNDKGIHTDSMDILLSGGKIQKIGKNIKCEKSKLEIVNIENNYTTCGFIDCHTHLGIIEEATGKIGIDNNETSEPITPQLRGIDGINPMDIAFRDAIASGVTTVMSGPGSNNAVGGQSAAIKTYGTIIDRMIVKNPAGFKIALGENPLSTYGVDNKCPVTRMGTAALIRELFMKTQDYIYLKENNKIDRRDIKLEAVVPVLKGQLPLRAHAHRVDDIATAVRIAEEFNIKKLIIEHGTEAHLIKDYLKEKKVPVAFGPMLTPRIKMELKSRRYSSIIELAEAGVKTALITDHPYNSIDQLRSVAILAISEGLSPTEALKCLTIHPAEILECSDRIGKLCEGYDADIVIFNGPPFEINSKVMYTIIDGRIVYKNSTVQ